MKAVVMKKENFVMALADLPKNSEKRTRVTKAAKTVATNASGGKAGVREENHVPQLEYRNTIICTATPTKAILTPQF